MEKTYKEDTVLIKLIYYCNLKREIYFKRKDVTDYLLNNPFFDIPNKQGFDGNLSYFGFDIQNDSDNNRILVLRGKIINTICLNQGFKFLKENNKVTVIVGDEYANVFDEIDALIKNKTNEAKAFEVKDQINKDKNFKVCDFRVFRNKKIYTDGSNYYYYPKVIINPINGKIIYEIVNSIKLLELNPGLIFPIFNNNYECINKKIIKYEDFFYNGTLGSGDKDFYYFILENDKPLEIDIFETSNQVIIDAINEKNYDLLGRETTIRVLSNIRLNTNTLRAKTLLRDKNKCQLCGISDSKLLICSHIQPWRTGSARLDLNNVITLCILHDSLFDKGYITFDDEGNLIKSDINVIYIEPVASFMEKSYNKLELTLTAKMIKYLKHHRMDIFIGDKNKK